MAAQLKGLLFDFDDTLVDWSGVQLGWREIEAARLSRVKEFVQRQVACLLAQHQLALGCLSTADARGLGGSAS